MEGKTHFHRAELCKVYLQRNEIHKLSRKNKNIYTNSHILPHNHPVNKQPIYSNTLLKPLYDHIN